MAAHLEGTDDSNDGKRGPLFRNLALDEVDPDVTEIESLCMECERNGTTKLLLTKIPMFKEVVVGSFYCTHCGFSNSSIQSGAAIEERGVKYTFRVQKQQDLNRMVVKADTATVRIPELEFEIPSHTQKGRITTIESILMQSVEGLEKEQPIRKALDPALAAKLEAFIGLLKNYSLVKETFTFVIDDPAGNSFIENELAPNVDPQLDVEHYVRSEQQDKEIGASIATQSESSSDTPCLDDDKQDPGEVAGYEARPVEKDEVVSFPTNCSQCNSPTETRMKLVDIPYFKQVIIMATTCNYCGCRSNEVKSGSGVSETGTRISLTLTHVSDLSRDVIKAESAVLYIPTLNFEYAHSSSGGKFTTVEGMLTDIRSQLQKCNPFVGDSAKDSKLKEFLDKLTEIIDGKKLGVDIIIDDPAGNSFIQGLCAPEPDPNMTVTYYHRTDEQNEQLGLNDMKTENYIEDSNH